MERDKIIEQITKALIQARGSFIFIFREASLNEALSRVAQEADEAISAIEKSLYESLLKDDRIDLNLEPEKLKH